MRILVALVVNWTIVWTVEERVYMQFRRRGFSGQFSYLLNEFFLLLNIDILVSEEYYPTLTDYVGVFSTNIIGKSDRAYLL